MILARTNGDPPSIQCRDVHKAQCAPSPAFAVHFHPYRRATEGVLGGRWLKRPQRAAGRGRRPPSWPRVEDNRSGGRAFRLDFLHRGLAQDPVGVAARRSPPELQLQSSSRQRCLLRCVPGFGRRCWMRCPGQLCTDGRWRE
jgi:hypothetical protein